MFASRAKSLSADLVASAAVPFVAVWVYEIANWLVLAAQGYVVSFSVTAGLPVGVAVVSAQGVSPLTKVFQVAISVGLLSPLAALFSRKGLFVAEAIVISTLGAYVASSYWELLSVLTVIPVAVHVLVFLAGTGILAAALLHALGQPRSLSLPPSTAVTCDALVGKIPSRDS